PARTSAAAHRTPRHANLFRAAPREISTVSFHFADVQHIAPSRWRNRFMPAHRFSIGQFECLIVKAGGKPLPLSYLLASVPEDQLEQATRADGIDPQALDFSMNILVVNTGRQSILIDTGVGDSNLPEKLRTEGIDPAAINTVVVTHGHGDHVGG